MAEEIRYKKGDLILVKRSNNGQAQFEGHVCEVMNVYNDYLSAVSKDTKMNCTLYTNTKQTGIADELCYADRQKQIEWTENKIKDLKTQTAKLEAEADRLRKFKDAEEEVAYKLDQILKAKGPKQIAEILRELKKSDYL